MNKKMDRRNNELIGRSLDQYKITGLIKETARSWVFDARDSVLDREVALKVLKSTKDVARQDQFLKEVRALATLEEHDNIVTVYAASEDQGLKYMAMKLIEGEDLEDLLRSGKRFSDEETLDILTDVVEGVSYTHSKGLQHGDIKPANIKRKDSESGKSYLIDFGGRLTGKGSTNDVVAIGLVARQLLEHREKSEKRIPRRLDGMVKMAEEDSFETPEDLRIAVKSYKRGITRRKFLKWSGVVAAALSGLSYGGVEYNSYKKEEHKRILDERRLLIEHNRYLNSMDFVVDEIAKVEASDYKNIDPLFRELVFRIFVVL